MKRDYIKYITLFYLIILSTSCNYNNDYKKELQLVLSDFSTSGFFFAINITCEEESFPIIITNNDLYYMLHEREIVKSQEDYINIIIEKIIKKEAIPFNSGDKEMLKSYSVAKTDTLDIFLKKNRNEFINKYFENNRFKSEVFTFDQEKEIIYCLFKNRIYCRRDCVSGYVFITPIANKVEKHNQ